MVTNIDDNVGRLLATLDESRPGAGHDRRLPDRQRPAAGALQQRNARPQDERARGRHSRPLLHPLAGGAAGRPGRRPDRRADRHGRRPCSTPAAWRLPEGVAFDGKSLLPLLKGDVPDWPDRTLFAQWHRGDVPERYRAFAARSQRYKLVRPEQAQHARSRPCRWKRRSSSTTWKPTRSRCTISPRQHPDIVDRLRAAYDRWFDDVGSTRGYDPPRIALGRRRRTPRS